jgi:competence protein ComEC
VLYREIPFLRIIVPLCLGIISGLYIHPGIYACLAIILAGLAGLAVSISFNKNLTNHIYGISFSVALYACGLILYTGEKNRISVLRSEKTMFISELTDYPEEKENTYMLSVKLNRATNAHDTLCIRGSMILYHRKDSITASLLPGDILIFRTTPSEIVNRGNPDEFDYRFYMESKGIRYSGFLSPGDLVSVQKPAHRKLKASALIVRNKIIGMYEKRGIKGERLALVAAITLGQKSKLDPEQKQNFIRAGVMHIMAVSGLHAVILSLFILSLLFFLKRRFNTLRILIAVIFIWAFAFVTGLTPSVLRATLMFSFLQAGNLMRRRVNGINSVLASAFVLILIRPSVIFDAGFLLSYAAVLYIIGFYQDLYLKITFRYWLPDKIWQSVAVTLIAQAGTLPLTIMLFNRFPTLFIITNLLIVPLSSVLIVTGCLVPMTYPIVTVSTLFARILDKLTGLTEIMTARAAALPCSTIDFIGLSPVECILLTIAVSLMLYFLLRNRPFSIKYPIVAFLIFSIAFTVNEIRTRKTNELIVYNTVGKSTVGIRTGKLLTVYSESTDLPQEVIRHASASRLRTVNNLLKKPCLIRAGKETVLISDTLKPGWLINNKPSVIVLTGTRPFIEKNAAGRLPSDLFMILPQAPPSWRIFRYADMSDSSRVWLIRKSGAYRRKI